MIYALLSKIVASRIYAILWAKSLRMPGLGGGGGVNLIQAMPEFWEHLVLAPLPYSFMKINPQLYNAGWNVSLAMSPSGFL